MLTDYRLNLTDTQSRKEEIESMMDEILPLIEDYFKEYGATINKVTYDSTYEFGSKTKIVFGITAPGFYPSFTIEILQPGSYKVPLSPSQRMFRGVFVLRGIPDERVQRIQKEFKEGPVCIIDTTKNKTQKPKEKILELFERSKEVRENWHKYNIALDIFVF